MGGQRKTVQRANGAKTVIEPGKGIVGNVGGKGTTPPSKQPSKPLTTPQKYGNPSEALKTVFGDNVPLKWEGNDRIAVFHDRETNTVVTLYRMEKKNKWRWKIEQGFGAVHKLSKEFTTLDDATENLAHSVETLIPQLALATKTSSKRSDEPLGNSTIPQH